MRRREAACGWLEAQAGPEKHVCRAFVAGRRDGLWSAPANRHTQRTQQVSTQHVQCAASDPQTSHILPGPAWLMTPLLTSRYSRQRAPVAPHRRPALRAPTSRTVRHGRPLGHCLCKLTEAGQRYKRRTKASVAMPRVSSAHSHYGTLRSRNGPTTYHSWGGF